MAKRTLLFCLLLLAANTAIAATEITTLVGQRILGEVSDNQTNDSLEYSNQTSYGLIINLDDTKNTQYEGYLSRQVTSLKPEGYLSGSSFDLSIIHAQLGGSYVFYERKHIHPFVGATLGIVHVIPEEAGYNDKSYFAYTINGGVKLMANDHLGLRLEARMINTVVNGSGKIFCNNNECLVNIDTAGFNQLEFSAGLLVRF